MAGPTIKATLKMDGEKEFNRAVKDIGGELKTLQSELNLATERFHDEADSVEALTAKNDILQRTLDTQKEKVDTLRKAHEKAIEAYGESSSRTQIWERKLNDAEAAVYGTERAIRDNNLALDEANEKYDDLDGALDSPSGKMVDLGKVVEGIAGKFGIDLPEGMADSISGFGEISASAAGAAGGIALTAAAVAKLLEKTAELTKERAAAADEINTTANIYGISPDTVP